MAVELDTICPDSLRAFECTRNDWDATRQSRSTGASHNPYSPITERDGAVQQTQLNYRQTLNSNEGMYNRYVYTKLNKVADNAKGPDIIIVLLDVGSGNCSVRFAVQELFCTQLGTPSYFESLGPWHTTMPYTTLGISILRKPLFYMCAKHSVKKE